MQCDFQFRFFRQRYSTSSVDPGYNGTYGYRGGDYGVPDHHVMSRGGGPAPEYGIINKSSQKLVGNSDVSSSTLGK